MSNSIPIVFATNDNYIKPTLTCIISILENKKDNTCYEFFIMHSGLKKESIDIFDNYAKKNNASINFINVSEYIKNINFDDFMRIDDKYDYITGETFYRFFMPSLFKDYDKMIYLDSDTIVTNDLTDFFNTDVKGYYLAGAKDLYIMSQVEHIFNWNSPTISTNQPLDIYLKEVLDIQDLKYFNAGVLIFNLEEMRKDDIENKLLKYAQSHLHLEYQDQDILNAVCKGKIKEISLKYNKTNFPQHGNDKKKFSIRIQTMLNSKPVIIHHTGKFKPWTVSKCTINDKIQHLFFWWKYYTKSSIFKPIEILILFNNAFINCIVFLKKILASFYWFCYLKTIRTYWFFIILIIDFYWFCYRTVINFYWFCHNKVINFYWFCHNKIIDFYWFCYRIIVDSYWFLKRICRKTYKTFFKLIKRLAKKMFYPFKKLYFVISKVHNKNIKH